MGTLHTIQAGGERDSLTAIVAANIRAECGRDRSSAPRMTVFGVFCVCRSCRAAGHMGVRP